MAVEDYQKEEFINKISGICFSLKSVEMAIEGEVGEWVNAYRHAEKPAEKMEELLAGFWTKSEEERKSLIDQMFAIEAKIHEKQTSEAGEESFDFFND